jgi:hypothetical protein
MGCFELDLNDERHQLLYNLILMIRDQFKVNIIQFLHYTLIFSWGARPLNEDMLLQAAEECHCLVTALYRLLCAQLPDSCRRLFDEKCLEACLPQRPAEKLHQSSSSHQLRQVFLDTEAYMTLFLAP